MAEHAAGSAPTPLVQRDQHAGVLTLTLRQPKRLNALSTAMLAELGEALRAAQRDPAVRAVVLTGEGRAFSAGADLSEFELQEPGSGGQPNPALGDLLRTLVNPIVLRLQAIEKPILAAVNGVCAGAGVSLALACDVRYAAESARFIQAFVHIGLVPDAGSTYFLPRLVGTSKALELAWTGEALSAQEALDLGVVNRVVPDAEVLSETQALAARLAAGPMTAMGLIKRGFRQAHEQPLERLLELEAAYQEIASRTDDFLEGVAAFREKRTARFGA